VAHNERLVDASPEAVFGVLADPRSYAYWVVGSIEIRDADPNWPEVGSRFHHTVGIGPLRVKDYTVVEDVKPGRFLQLQTKTRPLGNARVKLELERLDGRTRVTMTEDAADKPTAFVFMPLTHLLVRGRNVRSLDRLAELAEGRRPVPGEEAAAPARTPRGEGSVENPEARARRELPRHANAALIVRGALAGLAGALLMSVSTNAEMRLRGRPPSYAPAKAIGRLFGLRIRGKQRKKMLGTAGHLATAISIGALRGLLDRVGLGSAKAGVVLFGIAMTPEVVIVPALGAADPPWRWSGTDAAVSILHHAVFASATSAAYELLD
jgi:uncharacterized protein YndB with AHSA1/START domain